MKEPKYFKDLLPSDETNFNGLFIGDDYTDGLAIWVNDRMTTFSSQSDSNKGFKFITRGAGKANTPLYISDNSVAIGGYLDSNNALTVTGQTLVNGKGVFTEGLSNKDFIQGPLGSGYNVFKDGLGKWTLEIDKLSLRDDANSQIQYKTNALDGSLILNYSISILSTELVETIPVYIRADRYGKYADSVGTIKPLSEKATHAKVFRITPSKLDIGDIGATYQTMKLNWGVGDRDEKGQLVNYTTYIKSDVEGRYDTLKGTHTYDGSTIVPQVNGELIRVDDINVYEIKVSTDVSSFAVGDLLYYQFWDTNKDVQSRLYVEVVNITDNSLYVYSYKRGVLLPNQVLIKMGNVALDECVVQLSSSNKHNPNIEVISNIESFNDFVENIYYVGDNEPDLSDVTTFSPAQTRVRVGLLNGLVNDELSLTDDGQVGFYSDNAYVKGNFVANKLILGDELTYIDGVLNIKSIDNLKVKSVKGVGALEGGGSILDGDVEIKHKQSNFLKIEDLKNGQVISNIDVDEWGHIVGLKVRDINSSEDGFADIREVDGVMEFRVGGILLLKLDRTGLYTRSVVETEI